MYEILINLIYLSKIKCLNNFKPNFSFTVPMLITTRGGCVSFPLNLSDSPKNAGGVQRRGGGGTFAGPALDSSRFRSVARQSQNIISLSVSPL